MYVSGAREALVGYSKKALVVPFVGVSTEYRDNTQAYPDTQFTDSFLVLAANTFIMYEAAGYYSPIQPDSTNAIEGTPPRYSVLAGDTADRGAAAEYIRGLCSRFGTDLVIVPHRFETGYKVYQAEGWRHNEGPGYARPVEADGFARVHIQIWDSKGKLLYERLGTARTGKPMLFGMFNGKRSRARRRKTLEQDVVRAARKLYAPPIIRAIGKATKTAMLVR
jgi:hypothetical protein